MTSIIQNIISTKLTYNETESYIQQFIEMERIFWEFQNIMSLLPLGIITLIRFIKRNKNIESAEISPQKLDYIVYFFIRYYVVHYIIGIFEIFIYWELKSSEIGFVFHHVSSVVFLPLITELNFYPWFQINVFFCHALLTVFSLNIVFEAAYVISFIISARAIKAHPYSTQKRFIICEQQKFAFSLSLILIFGQYYSPWKYIYILFGYQNNSQ